MQLRRRSQGELPTCRDPRGGRLTEQRLKRTSGGRSGPAQAGRLEQRPEPGTAAATRSPAIRCPPPAVCFSPITSTPGRIGEDEGKQRACWNPALERSFVEILHEHNNTSFRGDHGWTSEAWNRIVKELHDRNKYVSFTKIQVQNKEKELKRDYRMLKEARKRSGCGWNEKKCMIVAEPALWDNLISSYPKIKKFWNIKGSFPLFDSLGQLYDGRLAEGIHNCTSLESPQKPLFRQIGNVDDEYQVSEDTVPYGNTRMTRTEDEDASAERIVAESRNEESVARNDEGIGHSKRSAALPRDKEEREGKKPSGKPRACWNPDLERSLVKLLHEHNNTYFRGDNGWTSEGWNRMVKEFHDRNKYISFTKIQVQDKEKELKRDYKMLKEARKRSGCGWNEKKCMIVAEPALWNNLISSYPKIKKFWNNKGSFPLFDSLGQLYDGRLAEGIHNCASLESQQEPHLKHIGNVDDEFQVSEETAPYENTRMTRTEDEDASAERIVAESRNEEWEAQNDEGIGHSKRSAALPRDKGSETAPYENTSMTRTENEDASAERIVAESRNEAWEAQNDEGIGHSKRSDALPRDKEERERNKPSGKPRACWNPDLERSLVEILHEHNNTYFRGDNGWTSQGWKKIVKEFHDRNKYVSFTKIQVQEKEKELKRDYKMLKDARKRSGCVWNEEKCTIVGEPELWDNLLSSYPRIKKFRNHKASFPLFDSLGQLYDGRLVEGVHNFTSLESPQEPLLRQIGNVDDEFQDLEEIVPNENTGMTRTEDEEASAERIVAESSNEESEARYDEGIGHSKRPAPLPREKEEREGKKPRKSSNIEAVLERYLEMRAKQVEDKSAHLAKEREDAQGADYSIKRCISVLNSLDVTKTEKAKAYVVFKSKENREIFLSACEADEESALIWLRNEVV